MNHLKLINDALDVGKISELVSEDSCGAISVFAGTTRNSFEGKQVLSLEYEAYEPMALKQLELICKNLREQWPDIANIAIFHRLGLVRIKEISVVIAISSPHRETSLKAVAAAIEDLKKCVPIWKKEIYKEDEATWKENKEFAVKSNIFNTNMCHVEDPHMLPSEFVQISACEDEIKRRIQCFVEKKRNEINFCNIMDFTDVTQNNSRQETNTIQEEDENNEQDTMTCARVNSNVVKQEFSKCHLKVRRAENTVGPQTRPDYLNALDKLMIPNKEKNVESELVVPKIEKTQSYSSFENSIMSKYPAILERLENIEQHLTIPQSKNQSIYKRLKFIEDRLLYLECISPEYVHFLNEKSQDRNSNGAIESFKDVKPTNLSIYERKLYPVSEIDTTIQKFEESIRNQSSHAMD